MCSVVGTRCEDGVFMDFFGGGAECGVMCDRPWGDHAPAQEQCVPDTLRLSSLGFCDGVIGAPGAFGQNKSSVLRTIDGWGALPGCQKFPVAECHPTSCDDCSLVSVPAICSRCVPLQVLSACPRLQKARGIELHLPPISFPHRFDLLSKQL